MGRLLVAAVLAILFAGTPASSEVIGQVKRVEGQAFVITEGLKKPAAPGDPVDRKDVLETGADGSLGVTFVDDTRLSLGPATSIALERYAFAPAQKQYGFVARMTRGTALFISGLLGKLAPETVSLESVRTASGPPPATRSASTASDG